MTREEAQIIAGNHWHGLCSVRAYEKGGLCYLGVLPIPEDGGLLLPGDLFKTAKTGEITIEAESFEEAFDRLAQGLPPKSPLPW